MVLPSICVSNDCGLFRLNTTRVRLPACTTLRLRTAGWPTSCAVRPRPLPVSGKSSAMRGGFVIAKPAGGLGSGAFSVNLITVRPELAFETLTESMLFPAWAQTGPALRVTIPVQNAATTAHARQRKRRDSVEGKGLIVFASV